jgi:hypothetical protein
MVEKGNLNLPDFAEVTGGDQFSNFTVQTEVKVLTSSDLALKTMESINYAEKTGTFCRPTFKSCRQFCAVFECKLSRIIENY